MNCLGAECWHDAGPGGPILTGMRRSHIKSDEALLVHRVTVEPVSSEGPSPWTTVKLEKIAFPDEFVHACPCPVSGEDWLKNPCMSRTYRGSGEGLCDVSNNDTAIHCLLCSQDTFWADHKQPDVGDSDRKSEENHHLQSQWGPGECCTLPFFRM